MTRSSLAISFIAVFFALFTGMFIASSDKTNVGDRFPAVRLISLEEDIEDAANKTVEIDPASDQKPSSTPFLPNLSSFKKPDASVKAEADRLPIDQEIANLENRVKTVEQKLQINGYQVSGNGSSGSSVSSSVKSYSTLGHGSTGSISVNQPVVTYSTFSNSSSGGGSLSSKYTNTSDEWTDCNVYSYPKHSASAYSGYQTPAVRTYQPTRLFQRSTTRYSTNGSQCRVDSNGRIVCQ